MPARFSLLRLWPHAFGLAGAIILLASVLLGQVIPALAAETSPPADMEVFVLEGCPQCKVAQAFLGELARERPGLRVSVVDIRRDPGALARLSQLSRDAVIARPSVPTFRIGTAVIVGFDAPETTGAQIRTALDQGGFR